MEVTRVRDNEGIDAQEALRELWRRIGKIGRNDTPGMRHYGRFRNLSGIHSLIEAK